jgi:hypothetical protein
VLIRTSWHWLEQMAAFSPADARALDWLREHAAPGDLVANDGGADAGIWAPYRAQVAIVDPRSGLGADGEMGALVLANVGRLDTTPAAAAAACASRVRWVYRGAKGTRFERRSFPEPAALSASPALELAFASGEAAVFRVRLDCPGADPRP